jgi:hypothetical protein
VKGLVLDVLNKGLLFLQKLVLGIASPSKLQKTKPTAATACLAFLVLANKV